MRESHVLLVDQSVSDSSAGDGGLAPAHPPHRDPHLFESGRFA